MRRRRSALTCPQHKKAQHNEDLSDEGGQRAACVYTITETAKMHGLNPQAYLADILGRIADHPSRQLDALLPWNWTP